MATDVFLKGATVTFNTTVQMATLQNLTGLDWSGASRDAIETTHLGTTYAGRTYVAPLWVDPGELTLTGRCDPTQAATFDAMYATAVPHAPVEGALAIAFKTAAGAAYKTWTWTTAFLTSIKWNGEFDGQLQGTFVFKLSGDCVVT